MPWWITVYATRSVAHLTAGQLATGLRDGDREAPAGVDYALFAEGYEIDEALVEPALANLRVMDDGGDFEVHFDADPEMRPITVHRWSEPARVAEELAETRENRDPPPSIEARLADVVEVVGLELGFPMLETMGIVLATELARYLAQKGAGFFVDDDGQWFEVRDGIIVDVAQSGLAR
jgi:hypothetical protein